MKVSIEPIITIYFSEMKYAMKPLMMALKTAAALDELMIKLNIHALSCTKVLKMLKSLYKLAPNPKPPV